MANSPSRGLSSSSNSGINSWPVRLLLGMVLAGFAICLWFGIRAALARPTRPDPLPPQGAAVTIPTPMETRTAPTAANRPLPGDAPAPSPQPTLANPAARPTSTLPAAPAAAQPAAPTPTKPPSPPTVARRTYTLQPGDSLPQIAAQFKVEPLALMQANHIANPLAIAAGQVLVIPPSSAESRRVVVDLSEQRLYAYEGDELVFRFVASTGQNDGTLRGSFNVLDKVDNAYSEIWGFWMPNWLGIYYATDTVENGIHALPLNKNGQRLYTDTLGQPVSAGCVMLAPEDAQTLFEWVVVGTPVLIRD